MIDGRHEVARPAPFSGGGRRVPEALVRLDLRGKVRWISAASKAMTGYDPEDLEGRDWAALVHPQDRPLLSDCWRRVSAGLDQASCSYRTLGAERGRRTEATFWLVRDPVNGRPCEMAGVLRAIAQEAGPAVDAGDPGVIAEILIANLVDHAIYLLDPDGRVCSWNAGAQRIKGYDAAEIIGSNYDVFFTEEAVRQGEPVRALRSAARNGKYEGEGWRVRKDGSRFRAHVVIDAVRDAAGALAGFAKVTRDVTESATLRDQSERAQGDAERARQDITAVNEANRQMAMAEQLAAVGYWRLDLQTQELTWSDEVRRTHGLPQSYIPTLQTALDAYEPSERPRIARFVERARTHGTPFTFESRIVRPDGSLRTVLSIGQAACDADGTITEIFGVIQDITERKAAELERDSLLARLNVATRAATVGIWDWDVEGRTLVWDATMFALYGFEEGAFQPTYERWAASLHDDDAAQIELDVSSAIEHCKPLNSEFRITWPNGEVHHIRVLADVIRDATGIKRMIGTNWDITEIRTVTEQFRVERENLVKTVELWMAAKEAADQARRLAANAAAHDPLTGLLNRRGFEEWIESRPQLAGTLLYLDIDGFKAINDRGGHAAGDTALQSVARILRRVTRRDDCCARIGGDEFVVALFGTEDTAIRDVVERIASAVEDLRPLGEADETRIGVSTGIARLDAGIAFDAALRQADAGLYAQKCEHRLMLTSRKPD